MVSRDPHSCDVSMELLPFALFGGVAAVTPAVQKQ